MEYLAVYLIYFALELFLCYFASKSKSKIWIFLSFIFPIFFIGLRYNVGTDYKNYSKIFDIIKSIDNIKDLLDFNWEIGAKLLFKIVSLLFDDNKIIFVFIALLTIYPIYRCNKMFNYKYLVLSMLIFNTIYMPFCMNGMRQGIAMSCILYSIVLAINEKKIKSILWLLIAISFHSSAFIVAPYLLVNFLDKSNNKNKSSKYTIYLTIIMSIIVLIFLKDLINNAFFSSYSFYIKNINTNSISFSSIIISLPTIIIVFLMKSKDKYINTFSVLLISGIIFKVVGTSAQYLNRISLYFTFFEILLIPYLIQKIEKKQTKFIVLLMYALYLIAYFIFQYYILDRNEIFPYRTWILQM